MVYQPPDRQSKTDEVDRRRDVVDPITGKPLHEARIGGVVIGPEVEAEEMGDDITGPEDPIQLTERSRSGVQIIAQIDPNDLEGSKTRLREAWRDARKQLGLDES